MIFIFKYTETDNCTYWCDQDIYIQEESLSILSQKVEKTILNTISSLIEKGLSEEDIENTPISIFGQYIPLKDFYDITFMEMRPNLFVDITNADYYIFETVFTDKYTYSLNTTIDFHFDLDTIHNNIKNAVSEKIDPLFKKYQTLNIKKGKILNNVKADIENYEVNVLGEYLLISELIDMDTLELNYHNKLFHIKDYSLITALSI